MGTVIGINSIAMLVSLPIQHNLRNTAHYLLVCQSLKTTKIRIITQYDLGSDQAGNLAAIVHMTTRHLLMISKQDHKSHPGCFPQTH